MTPGSTAETWHYHGPDLRHRVPLAAAKESARLLASFRELDPGTGAPAGTGDSPARSWILDDTASGRTLLVLITRDALPASPPRPSAGDLVLDVAVTIEPLTPVAATAARLIEATAADGRLDALTENWSSLRGDYLPVPGFGGALLSTDARSGSMRSLTLWESEAHRDAHVSSGGLARSVGSMRPFFRTDPVRSNWTIRHVVGGPGVGLARGGSLHDP